MLRKEIAMLCHSHQCNVLETSKGFHKMRYRIVVLSTPIIIIVVSCLEHGEVNTSHSTHTTPSSNIMTIKSISYNGAWKLSLASCMNQMGTTLSSSIRHVFWNDLFIAPLHIALLNLFLPWQLVRVEVLF